MKTKLTRIEKSSRIVLALLEGVLIWGAAINEELFSVVMQLPFDVALPDQYIVLGNTTDSVKVTFTGSGWEMLRFQITSPPPGILKEIRPSIGQSYPAGLSIDLNRSDILPFSSVSVNQIFPDQLSLVVDTGISRKLPVSVSFADGIPGRFRFFSFAPSSITVTGPASAILALDSILTDPVEISSGYGTASLALCGDMVAYSEDFVQVQIFEPAVPEFNLSQR